MHNLSDQTQPRRDVVAEFQRSLDTLQPVRDALEAALSLLDTASGDAMRDPEAWSATRRVLQRAQSSVDRLVVRNAGVWL